MNKEESLDLSQVSVANLLNDNAPSGIPQTEEAEAVAEETVAEEPVTEESPVEEEVESETPVAEDQSEVESETLSEEPAEEEVGVIDTLRQKFGYEITGEYKDDYDGVVNFTQQVANEIAKEQLDSVFGQFPDVEQYLQFRYNGGDPKKYFQATSPEVDFSAVELSEEDLSMQRLVVAEHLGKQGYSQEEVAETVQEYIDAGILYKHAQRGLNKLQAIQEREAKEIIATQQKQAEETKAQLEKQWTSIKDTIDQGRLKTFEIPSADKKKFYSWMSEAVDKQGRTQRLIDREAMDLETQLAIEYLAWKKLDLSKLVSATKKTKQAQNLKAKLQQTQTASRRMKGGTNSAQKAPKKLPSLKELL